MGFFSNLSGQVSLGKASIGDTINSLGNSFSGWSYGIGGYNRLRATIQTAYAREMMDQRDIKRDLKILHKVRKDLARFDEKRLGKIAELYSTNVHKFKKKVDKLADRYTRDLGIFVDTYSSFLKDINDMLIKEGQMQEAEQDYVTGVLKRLVAELPAAKVYLPESLISAAEKEFVNLEKGKRKSINKNYKQDVQLKRGKVKMGFWGFVGRGIYAVRHRLMKRTQKKIRLEFRDLHDNVGQIEQQLNNAQIQPDVLTRLLMHFKNAEKWDIMAQHINQDVKRIFSLAEEDFNEVLEDVAKFIGMFKNTEAVRKSKLAEKIKELQRDESEVNKIINADVIDQAKLYDRVKRAYTEVPRFFELLRRESANILREISANPREYIHKQV